MRIYYYISTATASGESKRHKMFKRGWCCNLRFCTDIRLPHSSFRPFIIRHRPRATTRTVLSLRTYLLYFFGIKAPRVPKISIGIDVPSAKLSMHSIPLLALPEEALSSHIALKAPHGISPVSNPTISGLPKALFLNDEGSSHGGRRTTLKLRRNGTPHIRRPIRTTSAPHIVKSMLLKAVS